MMRRRRRCCNLIITTVVLLALPPPEVIAFSATPRQQQLHLPPTVSSSTPRSAQCPIPHDEVVKFLESWFEYSASLKCPFFRRRSSDIVRALDKAAQSLHLIPKQTVPLGHRTFRHEDVAKLHLSPDQILEIIREDWKPHSQKGYYITGRFCTGVYTDDCVFDGPDPDMPVHGLRSYQMVANQLFCRKESHAELLGLHLDQREIRAQWKFQGTLRLPWKPKLPEVCGETTYCLNDENLIYLHKETWDCSAMEAFVRTVSPFVGNNLYGKTDEVMTSGFMSAAPNSNDGSTFIRGR